MLDRLTEQFPTAKKLTLRRMIQDQRVILNGTIATKASIAIEPEDEVRVVDGHFRHHISGFAQRLGGGGAGTEGNFTLGGGSAFQNGDMVGLVT